MFYGITNPFPIAVLLNFAIDDQFIPQICN